MKATAKIVLSLFIASAAGTCTAANISSPGAHTRRMQNPAYASYVGRLRDRRYNDKAHVHLGVAKVKVVPFLVC